jgi:hypothetical protein
MARICSGILTLVVAWAAASVPADGQDKVVTPAEEFQALAKEFNAEGFALRQAKTDEERLAVAERANKLTLKLLDLAQRESHEAVALDALVQVVIQEIWLENNTPHPGFGKDSPQVRAIGVLTRDYVRSDRIADTTRRVQYGFRPECETFLRAVLEKNPHREIQGLACLRLGQHLNARLQRLDLLQDQPEMAQRYEGLFGREYLAALRGRDVAEAKREVEAIFERAAKEFADVKLPWGGLAVGEKARGELYAIRHLAVGCQAPELAGEDQDGKPLALADYRGKVVLLYFWSEY